MKTLEFNLNELRWLREALRMYVASNKFDNDVTSVASMSLLIYKIANAGDPTQPKPKWDEIMSRDSKTGLHGRAREQMDKFHEVAKRMPTVEDAMRAPVGTVEYATNQPEDKSGVRTTEVFSRGSAKDINDYVDRVRMYYRMHISTWQVLADRAKLALCQHYDEEMEKKEG
jgi:hypothetical protein